MRRAAKSKYRAVRTVVDGIKFASKKEAAVYHDLALLQKANKISDLKLQPRIKLVANGIEICTYIADFFFIPREAMYGHRAFYPIYMDAKGFKTPIYKLKKKLVLALTGIGIIEV